MRISPHPAAVVDLFVTHTCAVGTDYTNAYYREHQVQVSMEITCVESDFIWSIR